ncbi:MAG: hypothetical protein KAT11_04720 [Phycisphaerae bacterium]|nr:hypothetical protein [Phycisphaerae bacterium]
MANHPDPQDLPEIVQQYIKRLARRVGNRHMRRDLFAELREHFADALANAPKDSDRDELAASLIADFGDTKTLARLIKRAKKRCRPLWVKFVIRTCQAVLVLLVIFAGYTYWFVSGRPSFRVDYWAKLTDFSRPVADESLNASPHYLKAIDLYVEPPEIELYRVKDKVNFGSPSPPPPGAIPFAPQTVERVITLEDIVKKPGTPVESNERQALEEWLLINRPALDELRMGTSKPHCWFHYELAQHNGQSGLLFSYDGQQAPLLNLLLPHLRKLRQVTFVLCWQMQFAAEKGNWDSVIADLRSAKALARHLMGCPALIEQLVGIAVDQRANKQLIHLLRSYRLPTSTLQRLAQSLPPDYPIIRMDAEAIGQMDAIQWLFTDDGSGDGHIIPGQCLNLNAMTSGEKIQSPDIGEIIKYSAGSMVHSSRRETVRLFEQWRQRARQYYSATPYQNHISGYSLNAWSNKKIKENPRNFLFRILVPSLEKASWISYAGQADHQAVQTIVALLRYKADHGQFPDKLDQLVPQYLKAVPLDPFGPGPLTYKRQDDDFLLYSLSFNFEDHGGQHNKEAFRNKKESGDYVFWPPEPVERTK